jgi:hypothetical protein
MAELGIRYFHPNSDLQSQVLAVSYSRGGFYLKIRSRSNTSSLAVLPSGGLEA